MKVGLQPSGWLTSAPFTLPFKRMRLLPGNVPFQQLQNPSLPIFKDVYFFNLTNPEEFAAGSPPNVIEIGPYSYE